MSIRLDTYEPTRYEAAIKNLLEEKEKLNVRQAKLDKNPEGLNDEALQREYKILKNDHENFQLNSIFLEIRQAACLLKQLKDHHATIYYSNPVFKESRKGLDLMRPEPRDETIRLYEFAQYVCNQDDSRTARADANMFSETNRVHNEKALAAYQRILLYVNAQLAPIPLPGGPDSMPEEEVKQLPATVQSERYLIEGTKIRVMDALNLMSEFLADRKEPAKVAAVA